KALVNHQARRNPLFAAESGDGPTESWRVPESLARKQPQNRHMHGRSRFGAFLFFQIMMRAC
ncbi:hypothetical protein, partial [Mesorhizobium sp. M7A.F.Ca.US.005.03.2.1]